MDDATLELLTIFKKRQTLNLSQLGAILNVVPSSLVEPVHYLMSLEYIEKDMELQPLDDDLVSLKTPLKITYQGNIAIFQALKEKKHFKYTEFRAWATLAIAVVALILSIISLFLQYI